MLDEFPGFATCVSKSRTEFSFRSVRGLTATVRVLSAKTMQLKTGTLLIRIGANSGIQVQRDTGCFIQEYR